MHHIGHFARRGALSKPWEDRSSFGLVLICIVLVVDSYWVMPKKNCCDGVKERSVLIFEPGLFGKNFLSGQTAFPSCLIRVLIKVSA